MLALQNKAENRTIPPNSQTRLTSGSGARKWCFCLFARWLAGLVRSGESRAGERDFCEQLLPTILLVWLPGPTMHTISFLTHILNLCLLGLMVNIVHLPPIRRFLYQNLLETRGLKGDNVFMIGGGWST